jgi:LacI family transcriptional regulator
MAEVAAAAGVSRSTVSRALAGHPAISRATVERVNRAAAETGYRTHPQVRTLMAQVRARSIGRSAETFAVLLTDPEPERWRTWLFSRRVTEGVERRAAELGYRVEDFAVASFGAGRLHRILRTRHVDGVLVMPGRAPALALDLPWNEYAAAAVATALPSTALHRVVPDHYGAVRLALARLAAQGCRRVGLVSHRRIERDNDWRWSAAYRVTAAAPAIPIFWMDDDTVHSARLKAWIQKHRIEAVIGTVHRVVEKVAAIPAAGRRPRLYTLEADTERPNLSGVDQNWRSIGATAFDLVLAQIHRNERGFPETPHTVVVPGRWYAGT